MQTNIKWLWFYSHIAILGEGNAEKRRREECKISQKARQAREGTAAGGDGPLRVSSNFLETK